MPAGTLEGEERTFFAAAGVFFAFGGGGEEEEEGVVEDCLGEVGTWWSSWMGCCASCCWDAVGEARVGGVYEKVRCEKGGRRASRCIHLRQIMMIVCVWVGVRNMARNECRAEVGAGEWL